MAILSPPRRLSRVARRGEILSAARRVFGARGYHEATTRDIAEAAGVSEALIYQHFAGKRQIFEAVIESAADELERMVEAAAGTGDPLRRALEGYFAFVEAEADLYRVFFHQALQADAAFTRLYARLAERFLTLVATSLDALGNPLSPVRSGMLAHALTGMVSELGLWWVDTRALERTEIVERAALMARAVYQAEVADGHRG